MGNYRAVMDELEKHGLNEEDAESIWHDVRYGLGIEYADDVSNQSVVVREAHKEVMYWWEALGLHYV